MNIKKLISAILTALAAVGITGIAAYLLSNESGIIKLTGFVFTKPVLIIGAALTALLFFPAAAASVYRKELKNTLFLWAPLLGLTVLWCAMFFVWNLDIVALALSAVCAGLIAAVSLAFANKTRELWLLLIVPLAFYICVFLSNYAAVLTK